MLQRRRPGVTALRSQRREQRAGRSGQRVSEPVPGREVPSQVSSGSEGPS
jgi:hypothetical protein